MIRALIFDFDGLILETEGPIYLSWKELYQAHQQPLTVETWSSIIGTAEMIFDPLETLKTRVGNGHHYDWEKLAEQRLSREIELIQAQDIRPGVRDYLESARRLGLKLAIASSSSCAWIHEHTGRLGLRHYFDCIRASDDVPRTKPDPALYLAALECLGLQPDEAVVFEDSPNGIRAAKRAGLFCVAVPNDLTRSLPLELADLQIGSMADVPLEELLASISAQIQPR